MLYNLLVQITVVQEIHHYAQARSLILEKGFLVPNDTSVGEGRQYADFVQSVFFFFHAQLAHLHFLESVDLHIAFALHFVYFRVSAIA